MFERITLKIIHFFVNLSNLITKPIYIKMKTLLLICLVSLKTLAQTIPLPEHPRPDLMREQWQNLNGAWKFEFDKENAGLSKNWQNGNTKFSKTINVPFPWGSALSAIKDEADIAWYSKEITVDNAWKEKKTFLVIGASDWETTVWIDGKILGKHEGGYTPFDFDLTAHIKYGQKQTIVVRVDDARRDFTLYGKQGYGNARGIWQTPYLESRGNSYIESLHFIPNIDNNKVHIKVELAGDKPKSNILKLKIAGQDAPFVFNLNEGSKYFEGEFELKTPILWDLDNPHLYDVEAFVDNDHLKTYFGFRKISVTNLPGTEIPYVALNNKPVYLKLALDQSYHPEGFYTFPTDEFMKNEIQLSKGIGLNGIRTHIKVDIPRKLYWADKLGLFVMSDLPNSWGEPGPEAQKESEYTLREMIKRDFNHPAIFSWIVFNETWGLKTKVKNPETGKEESKYLPKTQNWVASMYYLAKSLDQTRLVEDNSICCGAGHTETDLYTWHEYLPGYKWEAHLKKITENNFSGSTFNYENGFAQGKQPMLNSECGNVWGYDGSTGDVDWSYDYHRMMNVFKKYPKMSGWLYTEHHDVINEWNGYWRFDRTKKYTGLDEIVPGMTDNDFHSDIYLSTGQDITHTVNAGSIVKVPLFISSMTDKVKSGEFTLNYYLKGIDVLGNEKEISKQNLYFDYKPWIQKELQTLEVKMPETDGLYILALIVKDASGNVHHRNFVAYEVKNGKLPAKTQILEKSPNDYSGSKWSQKTWTALNGKKANGAGSGYFEYTFEGDTKKAKSGYLLMELGAKELFFKDKEGSEIKDTEYMLGAKAEPSQNKNSYPMTDETKFSSEVKIIIDNKVSKNIKLEDDPADHRGILSWHHQLENGKLDEAGSYGYKVKVPLTKSQVKSLQKNGKLSVKLSVEGNGGLAVYGKDFGRYPLGPSLVLFE